MEECISRYGEDKRNDIDRAFRIFEKISLGELAGILAVIGEDKLKNGPSLLSKGVEINAHATQDVEPVFDYCRLH